MSKTDHPRYRGTHQVGHAPRSWREMGKGDHIEWGTPKRVVRALLAVAEFDEPALDEPELTAECPEFEEFDIQDVVDYEAQDAYQDDLWAEDDDTSWTPWMAQVTIEEAREIFGGSDFMVVHAR